LVYAVEGRGEYSGVVREGETNMFQKNQIHDCLLALRVLTFWGTSPERTYDKEKEALELVARFEQITDQTSDAIWDALVADFLKLIQDKSLVNKKGQTPLNDDVTSVNGLCIFIQAGLDVNSVDAQGNTMLHRAALCGRSDMITLLLDAKANPNLINKDGQAPIHRAIETTNQQGEADACVDLLIKAKADLSIQDKQGSSPLLLAVMGEKNQIIHSLMKAGAEATKANANGFTPLSVALVQKEIDLKLVEYILDQGLDLNAPNRIGVPYLSIAQQLKNAELINLFITHEAKTRVQTQTHTSSPSCFSFLASLCFNRREAQVTPSAKKSMSVDL
jgi:ankyrin repeat protein